MELAVAALLDVAWTNIAATGWNRYQLHGRGAVLLSMAIFEGKSFDADYMTPSPSAPFSEPLASAVDSYDPETSVVLVFVDDDEYQSKTRSVSDLLEKHLGLLSRVVHQQVVERTPPPPECARAMSN